MASTTANAAPALTPSSPGSASGLRVCPCISAPATPSATPTASATSVRGARSARTITSASVPDGDHRARHTTSGGRGRAPTARLARHTRATSAAAASSHQPGARRGRRRENADGTPSEVSLTSLDVPSSPRVCATSVGGLVGLQHLGADASPLAHLVPVLPRPLADRGGVGATRGTGPTTAAGGPTTADSACVPHPGGQLISQPSSILRVEVDLVTDAVEGERDGLPRLTTIEVIDEKDLDLLCHAWGSCIPSSTRPFPGRFRGTPRILPRQWLDDNS